MGVNVLLRRMEKKYLFGFDYYKDGDFWLPYSDKEKTLIDMVYFKERLSKEAIKSFAKAINKNKLMQYLKHYPKRIKRAVLGYVNIWAQLIPPLINHFKEVTFRKLYKS